MTSRLKGRPILVRAYDPVMGFDTAVKLLMFSFDSTIKANLSLGLPLDFQIYPNDSYVVGHEQRVERDDDYFDLISEGWGDALRDAFSSLPPNRLEH